MKRFTRKPGQDKYLNNCCIHKSYTVFICGIRNKYSPKSINSLIGQYPFEILAESLYGTEVRIDTLRVDCRVRDSGPHTNFFQQVTKNRKETSFLSLVRPGYAIAESVAAHPSITFQALSANLTTFSYRYWYCVRCSSCGRGSYVLLCDSKYLEVTGIKENKRLSFFLNVHMGITYPPN